MRQEIADGSPKVCVRHPGEGGLDDPSARQADGTFHIVGALDDLNAQAGVVGDGVVHLASVVAVVRPDQFEPVEPLAYFVKDQGRAVAVLDTSRMSNHA
jgi:hypothetical protein